jgi:hypothetical protein
MANGEPGAPTDYRPEFDDQAFKLCLLGATDKELANFFNVTETTINNWKLKHNTFVESIKRGKEDADMKVAASLYDQALGYHYEEETEAMGENGAPMKFRNKRFAQKDFRATRFWLMNRQPEKWRDKTEVHNTGNMTVNWAETKTYKSDSEPEADAGA